MYVVPTTDYKYDASIFEKTAPSSTNYQTLTISVVAGGEYLAFYQGAKLHLAGFNFTPTVATYDITKADATGGSFTVKVNGSEATKAEAGAEVTLTATADDTHDFGAWTVTDADEGNVTVTDNKFTMPAKAVTVAATFTTATLYNVNINDMANGSVSASPTSAKAGGTVTLTVTPASGYELQTLTVKDANDNDVTVTDNQFTMPASAVTVNATFRTLRKTLTLAYSGDVDVLANETLTAATLTAKDGETPVDIATLGLTYETSDATVATVSDAGVVAMTGKVGSANITANFAGNETYLPTTASYTITVTAPAVTYNTVNVVGGKTWDFTVLPTSDVEDRMLKDVELGLNLQMVTNSEGAIAHRYANNKKLTAERLVAFYSEIEWTEGLYFTATKADNIRLNLQSDGHNIQLNGKDLKITIKGLKAGQKITVVSKTGSGSDLTRYVGTTNITTQEGFAAFDDTQWHNNIGTVTADGDIELIAKNGGINIQSITIEAATEAISTATERTYATYVTTNALDFSDASIADDIAAYKATGSTGSAVTLEALDKVPANTPVLVKTASAGATVNVPLTTVDVDAIEGNLLLAADGTTNLGGEGVWDFVLKEGKFCHINPAGPVAEGKAYLHFDSDPTQGGARELLIEFEDGGTTGIENINVKQNVLNGEFFNMAGQRVALPKKGLYIVNGKKVIIK